MHMCKYLIFFCSCKVQTARITTRFGLSLQHRQWKRVANQQNHFLSKVIMTLVSKTDVDLTSAHPASDLSAQKDARVEEDWTRYDFLMQLRKVSHLPDSRNSQQHNGSIASYHMAGVQDDTPSTLSPGVQESPEGKGMSFQRLMVVIKIRKSLYVQRTVFNASGLSLPRFRHLTRRQFIAVLFRMVYISIQTNI